MTLEDKECKALGAALLKHKKEWASVGVCVSDSDLNSFTAGWQAAKANSLQMLTEEEAVRVALEQAVNPFGETISYGSDDFKAFLRTASGKLWEEGIARAIKALAAAGVRFKEEK